MNTILYGDDALMVHGLLQRVLEERETIERLRTTGASDTYEVKIGGTLYCIEASELIQTYESRIADLSWQLEKYGIAVTVEKARPKSVDAPKRPVDGIVRIGDTLHVTMGETK